MIARTTLADFLADKGDLRVFELVTCLAAWRERCGGDGTLSTREAEALYPRRDRPPNVPPLRSPAAALRTAADAGLLVLVGPTGRGSGGNRGVRYALTDLGRAVVEALPDSHVVAAVRGLPKAAPRARMAVPPFG